MPVGTPWGQEAHKQVVGEHIFEKGRVEGNMLLVQQILQDFMYTILPEVQGFWPTAFLSISSMNHINLRCQRR